MSEKKEALRLRSSNTLKSTAGLIWENWRFCWA